MTHPPLICMKDARAAAMAAVQQQFGTAQGLTLLNPGAPEQASFVFRADLADAGHAVVKIGDPARIALTAARSLEVYPQMSEGRFRVPQIFHHDAAAGVLVMEDARGQSAQSLWLSGPAGATRALTSAGGWIARFHKPSSHMGAFNPDPHLNWLQKQANAHRDQTRKIPDFAAFENLFFQLTKDIDTARGQPILRCITHRDFHLRNLLIRNLGRSYGVDFENTKRDEALRDLLFFTADAARLQNTVPTAPNLLAITQPLRAAYNRPLGSPVARRVFQTAFALSGWASLDATTPLGPNRARALAVMQAIAAADDLFADLG